MPQKSTVTRRTALGLIGAGVLLTASETFGFSEIYAGRGVSVTASDDPSAYLGIDGTTADRTPVFVNNTTTYSMTVELDSDDDIEFDVNGEDEFQEQVEFDIEPGENQEIEVGGTDETAIVHIFADLEPTNSDDATGIIDLERIFEIPQTAAISDIQGSVDSAGNSGNYEFIIENTQPDDGQVVELDGLAISWTNNEDANQVGGHNDDILLFEDEQIIDEVIYIGEELVGFSRDGEENTVAIEPGDEMEFEFDRFREEDGGGSNVGVDDVDITVRATDGSTAQIELRS
ncbi:hypothetical protein SAMN05421809_1223 [Natronorubrum daqingense]|uniref:Uncharacterized protein n=1 Tax=Natronorubrum daqingense TaxID=588898 RepID=A0A1N7AMG5_9EURY|nr:hypothetical protein BB347_15690 [Natronorubrum daqingense]SIR40196.1 hypothetical protein SAMN05421809_1223 [Natronorubrum daqingense]